MIKSQSVAARAAMAVGLMFGFYVLAISLIALLLFIPVAEWMYFERLHFRIVIPCLFGAFLILVGIIPRIDRFEPPGPVLERREHPELLGLVEEVARATEQSMPVEVYLVLDVNAWVSERGGWMGLGSKRVMGLGLPLLGALTVSQLRAVIAHEFGHYYGGDTKLGPWIYKTRLSLERTIRTLSQGTDPESASEFREFLKMPFELYAAAFMRITQSVSRKQEFTADELAARIAGAKPMTDGLLRIHGAATAFPHYMANEVQPVLQAGFRPPLVEGFIHFMGTPAIAEGISQSVEHELAEGAGDPYDSHPPLGERLAALQGMTNPESPDHDGQAISLLNDGESAESFLFEWLAGRYEQPALSLVSWHDTGQTVWQPSWQDAVNANAQALSGIRPRMIPDIAKKPGAILSGFPQEIILHMPPKDRADLAQNVIGAAVSLALLDDGWQVTTLPGEEVEFQKAGSSARPLRAIHNLFHSKTDTETWDQLVSDLGIGNVDLGSLAIAPVDVAENQEA